MRERRRWLWLLLLVPIGLGLWWWARDERAEVDALSAGDGASPTGAPDGAAGESSDASATAAAGERPDAGAYVETRAPVRLSPARVVPDPSSAAGTLAGHVVGFASNAPVAGAELTFARRADGGDVTRSARTDEDGAFVFSPDAPGTYVLALVTAEGFLPFAPEWGQSPIRFEARAGVRVEGARITLVDAIEYTVVVTREGDAPVEGAEVHVFGLDRGERALAPMQDRWTTDAEGEAVIRAPDWAVIEARHEAHGVGRGAVGSAAQVSHRIPIRLRPEPPEDRRADAALLGRVIDEADRPVAGALVTARQGNPRSDELHPPLEGLTGSDGAFRLEGADRGRYRVVVTAEGYARARADDVPTGIARTIRLEPDGAVRVRVVDAEDEEPLGAWTVIVEQRRGAIEWDTLASESGYGDAEIEVRGLPRGPCQVLATSPGYAPSEPAQTVAAAEPRAITIALRRGGTITGRAVSAEGERPLEGARATVEGRLGSGASAVPIASTALTDEDGRFELTGVPRGLGSVVVWASGHHGRLRSGIVVGDDPVDLGTLDLSVVEEGEEPRIELAGIGAVLQADGDVMRITRVVEGGGAEEIGLGAGDAILRIEGVPVGELGFGGSIERIRGPEGSTVRLTIRRAEAEEPETLDVPRRRIRA